MDLDGPKVRRLREERGLSLRQLAALVPCSAGALSMIETGARRARPALAYRLAAELGTSVADLLAHGEDPS